MAVNKPYSKYSNRNSTGLVSELDYLLKTLAVKNIEPKTCRVNKKFPFLATKSWIQRITTNSPTDPLLKQIFPSTKELQTTSNFTDDPLHETKYNPIPGLLHKYNNRVLILLTNVCAMHCRFCFRKKFPYANNPITKTNWQRILKYIANHKNIEEIILSGGDPLTIDNGSLSQYIKDLANIQHLHTLRIHSRVPIVLPSRIQPSLIKVLTSTRLQLILVTHCNHPNEINHEVHKAIIQLSKQNIILLNQSVLLKNINDDPKVLVKLSKKLFSVGILPYYLHMHDKVTGTIHFYVPISKAKKLMKKLITELPGYLVPKLVKEVPGAQSKHPV